MGRMLQGQGHTHTHTHAGSSFRFVKVNACVDALCVLTTLVGGAAAVCGVGFHRQNLPLQADGRHLWTRGAHCGDATP